MKRKILLIDDSPAVHELVRASLEDESILLASAMNGEGGIGLARDWNPELILLDVDMPGSNGFDVCRRLREDVNTAEIPIVFLTGHGESQHKVEGLDLGGSDYITKPFDPSEFAARIRAVLRAKTRVDSIRSNRVNDFIRRSLKPVSARV